MGNGASVIEGSCVSLAPFPNLTSHKYIVKRTSGEKENGWIIAKPPVGAGYPSWLDRHAVKDENNGWRIFMHNNESDPNLFLCGWRRLDSIEPSILDSDLVTIDEWRQTLLNLLDRLNADRLKLEKTTTAKYLDQ